MNDHRRITWRKTPWLRFRPQEARLAPRLPYVLNGPAGDAVRRPDCCRHHHAPGWGSVAENYRNDRVTAAYATDLSDLIIATQPALWVHGHIHTPSDYRIGTTRVICNPHGYGGENSDFDPALVVEIP